MTRFYVTMTWHDWPEGGSYGTIVEAESYAEAEHLCHVEMAQSYAADIDGDPSVVLQEYSNNWHVVDCFDLDDFINRYGVKK